MNQIERIITRINELGLAMDVTGDRLLVEGNTRELTNEERACLATCKEEIIAHLTAPREHVVIMCKHRAPDGRACGKIVTLQRPSGKVAWCQVCYPSPQTIKSVLPGNRNSDETCYCCGHADWWLSLSGKRACRICHPPAYPELEQEWNEDVIASNSIPHPCELEEMVVPNVEHVVLPLRGISPTPPGDQPITMYVGSDLEYWTTDKPHMWVDNVMIDGKQFVRLTPETIAWFKNQIAKAGVMCEAGTLSLDDFARIVDAFCPVYAFAVRMGMIVTPQFKHSSIGGNHGNELEN